MSATLLFPNGAETALLEQLRTSYFDNGTLSVTLYENNHTPAATDTISDYTIGTITPVSLSGVFNAAAQDGAGKAFIDLTAPLTITNGSGSTHTYYGVLIYKPGSPNVLIAAGLYGSSVSITAGGSRSMTSLKVRLYNP